VPSYELLKILTSINKPTNDAPSMIPLFLYGDTVTVSASFGAAFLGAAFLVF